MSFLARHTMPLPLDDDEMEIAYAVTSDDPQDVKDLAHFDLALIETTIDFRGLLVSPAAQEFLARHHGRAESTP